MLSSSVFQKEEQSTLVFSVLPLEYPGMNQREALTGQQCSSLAPGKQSLWVQLSPGPFLLRVPQSLPEPGLGDAGPQAGRSQCIEPRKPIGFPSPAGSGTALVTNFRNLDDDVAAIFGKNFPLAISSMCR